MSAVHESTKPVAAEGMRNIVVFHSMIASARPCVAQGQECADSHANAGDVLEGLVAQAKGGGVGTAPSHMLPGRVGMLWRSPNPVGGPEVL
jgi:outer membrane lipoprotein SlyB